MKSKSITGRGAGPEMRRALECEVLANDCIARNTWLLTMRVPPDVLEEFSPGRFCDIRIPQSPQLILRRPFSIYIADRAGETVSIVFAVVGRGTEKLSKCLKGEKLNVLLPLGRGFDVPEEAQNIWLVGGGLGIGALGSAALAFPQRRFTGFFGFRSEDYVPAAQYLPQGLETTYIVTEDGSCGREGFVTDALAEALSDCMPDLILACGPAGMLRALRQLTQTLDVSVQASVEERMGCGTGGCETCVCSVNGTYLKSCTDGPVFALDEVDEYAG